MGGLFCLGGWLVVVCCVAVLLFRVDGCGLVCCVCCYVVWWCCVGCFGLGLSCLFCLVVGFDLFCLVVVFVV